jgi:hypothetical protein
MKKTALVLMAAAPLWAACSDSEVDWGSITALEGATGAEAAVEWRNALDLNRELQYPISIHWDIDVQMKDVPQPLGPAKDGFILASIDSTLFGGNQFRTRCSIEMAAWGRDEFITIHIDSDDKEVRLSHRGIDALGPFEIPAGMSLSADRLLLVTELIQRLVSNAPGFSADDLEFVGQYEGISDVFHPDNIARLLGPAALQQGCTWRESQSRTQVSFAPLMALANSEVISNLTEGVALPGFEQLSEMEVTVEFDRSSGAFHSLDSSFAYSFDELPLETKKQPSMMVTMHCETRDSEVSPVQFRERDTIISFNEDFDQGWPMIAAMEPAILEAYRKVADDFAESGDFSF